MLLSSPNPTVPRAQLTGGCWGTRSAGQPGPSAVLPTPEAKPWPRDPAAARGFAVYQQAPALPRLPRVPGDAPRVPGCSARPSSATGTRVPLRSPATLRAPPPAQPSKPWPHTSSFRPEKRPLSPRKQQVMVGPRSIAEIQRLLFSALPLLLPQVSGAPASSRGHPTANRPPSPHRTRGPVPGYRVDQEDKLNSGTRR